MSSHDQDSTTKTYTDAELRYAATARCPCGAGLAYPLDAGLHGAWDCADILTGRAVPSGQEGSVTHTDRLPFAFYEVKSEDQPSAQGRTTRPTPLTEMETLARELNSAARAAESASDNLINAQMAYEKAKAKREDAHARYFAAKEKSDAPR
ncbi:hypothetical protein [Humibacter sp.]|uniref:hypothetical protein n=1 Tax=Humibacter sp. TaxID=1940291 RepID=UPI003F8098CF